MFFLTESVTEGVFSQNEFNSSDLLLRMGDVTCVFLFVIVLKLVKKSYSKRRENMYPVSQEENSFQNQHDFQRQEGNQTSCNTKSQSMETTKSPLDTK